MIQPVIRNCALIVLVGMLAAVGCSSTPAPTPTPAPTGDAQADSTAPADAAAADAKACLPFDAVCTDLGAECCTGLICTEGAIIGGGTTGDGGGVDASGGNSIKRCQ